MDTVTKWCLHSHVANGALCPLIIKAIMFPWRCFLTISVNMRSLANNFCYLYWQARIMNVLSEKKDTTLRKLQTTVDESTALSSMLSTPVNIPPVATSVTQTPCTTRYLSAKKHLAYLQPLPIVRDAGRSLGRPGPESEQNLVKRASTKNYTTGSSTTIIPFRGRVFCNRHLCSLMKFSIFFFQSSNC